MTSPLLVIIPFYENPHLATFQQEVLVKRAHEFRECDAAVLLINDSPDNSELAAALAHARDMLQKEGIQCDLLTNPVNCGFVVSANAGLRTARIAHRDAVLLNSDAELTDGCLREMARIASLDEKFGFVGPRSTDASIATLPWQVMMEYYESSDMVAMPELMAKLPQYTLVPTLTGFCLLVKWQVLAAAGFLDEIYSPGYNEENDLIFRANRLGYRCVMANHALAPHTGSQSFGHGKSRIDARHRKILYGRYPEFLKAVGEYFGSPYFLAERLITQTTRIARTHGHILVDCSHIRPFYNGTFEFAIGVLRALLSSQSWSEKFGTDIIISREAVDFHGLSGLLAGHTVYASFEDIPEPYPFALSLAQPFDWNALLSLNDVAAAVGYYFLDVIADDCYYIRYMNQELHAMWEFVARTAASIGFLTEDARSTFQSRFGCRDDRHDYIAPPSCDPGEYVSEPMVQKVRSRAAGTKREKIIVVPGNAFAHKMVSPTVQRLADAFPDYMIHTMGYDGPQRPNVCSVPTGSLPEEELARLYVTAAAVVLPSTYEGFGFPLVKALAYGTPVVSRSTDVAHEVAERTGCSEHVQWFIDDDDLVTQVRRSLESEAPILDTSVANRPEASWNATAETFAATVQDAVEKLQFADVLERMTLLGLMGSYRTALRTKPVGYRASRMRRVVIQQAKSVVKRIPFATDIVRSARRRKVNPPTERETPATPSDVRNSR